MLEVPLETQQSKIVVNDMQAHTTKLELAHYFHATLFSLTTKNLLKAIKIGLFKTIPVLA